jgi:hypothetical protein
LATRSASSGNWVAVGCRASFWFMSEHSIARS